MEQTEINSMANSIRIENKAFINGDYVNAISKWKVRS